MGFDRAAAEAAGYTPQEIDAFLAQDQPKYTTADIKNINASLNPGGENYVPKWGEQNPNLYAGTMALLDAIPATASFAGKAKVGIPLAALLSSGAGIAKRSIEGKDTTGGDIALDALKGAGIEGTGRGLGALLSKTVTEPVSNWMIDKTLKFNKVFDELSPEAKRQMTDSYFKYGLSPNEAGWNKLQALLSGANSQRTKALQAATDAGVKIDPMNAVIGGDIPSLLKLGAEREGSYPGYNNKVKDIVSNFLKPGERTPIGLNEEKMQLQQMLADSNAFGSSTKSLPETEARKRLSHGSTSALNSIDGVAEPNQTMSELLTLRPLLGRATNRIMNKDVIGLKDAVLMPQAFNMSDSAGSGGALAALMKIINSPTIQDKTAKGIRATGNIASKIPARQAIRRGLEGALYSATGGPSYGE